MKTNYYFTESVKKEKENLIQCVENTKKRIELLKSIKRNYKKDGSNFQNFLQNFKSDISNCRIYYSYSWIEASVYPVEIMIDRYATRIYGKDPFFEKIEKEAPERIIKSYCIKDQIEYTPDEIMENIKKQIERENKNLIEYENQLNNFDSNVEKLTEKLEELEKFFNGLGDSYYKIKKIAEEYVKGYSN